MEARTEKYFFELIVKSISSIDGITKAWVKATAGSEYEIHFTKLTELEENQVTKFVQNCLLICGTDTKLLNFQVKIPGSESEFQGIDIVLNFDNQEQKQKYLEYRNQLLAWNVISVQLSKNVADAAFFYWKYLDE